MKLSAGDIARATRGRLFLGDPATAVMGVSSDSRKASGGELFVPLKGPRFDGHDFVAAAMAQGAAGSLVEEGREEWARRLGLPGKFFIAVQDVLQSLGDLAHDWRSRQSARIVAITGSNGKTTTKEMTAGIFSRRHRVLKTEGNLNNLVGLPLMLCRLNPEHELAVLEMGMSQFGEIRRLKEIADPALSLITNIGPVHTEFLGSEEGVARAKGELWENLRESDWIAVNTDDGRVRALAEGTPSHKKTYGIGPEAEVRGQNIALQPGRGIQFSLVLDGTGHLIRLHTFGRYHVTNALAAATLASIAGIQAEEIVAGLEQFQPYEGRGNILYLPKQIRILDESYNSNPVSLQATAAAFAEMKGENRGLAVIGDMLELGPGSAAAHEKSGRKIGAMPLDHIFALGKESRHLAAGAQAAGLAADRLHWAEGHEAILSELTRVLQPGDWILVKGSRGMRLERIIEGLRRYLEKG